MISLVFIFFTCFITIIHLNKLLFYRYLAALGKSRIAQVHRDAKIGEAKAKRDAGIKEAVANQERLKVRFQKDTEIAEAKRDYELKKAAYDIEVSPLFLSLYILSILTDR